MSLKRGDLVKIMTGKDKGKTGKIAKVVGKDQRVVVEGINKIKRHQKARAGKPAGIIEKNAPIAISNVGLICEHCQKVTKIGYKVDGKTKSRICKKCNEAIK